MSSFIDRLEPQNLGPVSDELELLKKNYFARPFKELRRWGNTITSSGSDDELLSELYLDCFSHHNDVRDHNGEISLVKQEHDPRRLFRKNNISAVFRARFLEALKPTTENSAQPYQLPRIYKNPNQVDDEEELGAQSTFDHLYSCVVAKPFDRHLEENRITFLIGEVGVGKTFVVSLLMHRLFAEKTDHSGFRIFPVYIDMEQYVASHGNNTTDSNEFVRRFLIFLGSKISQSFEKHCGDVSYKEFIGSISKDATSEQASLQIQHGLKALALNANPKCRAVIVLDNIDVLHYQDSRWAFFQEEYTKHRHTIEEKIGRLIFSFLDDSLLGDCGLCCLIVARENVARDSRLINQPALTRRPELLDHVVFQVFPTPAEKVLESRFAIFQEALALGYADGQLKGHTLADQLALFKVLSGISLSPTNYHDGLRRVADLCHHGIRSLVEFLFRLKVDLAKHKEIVDRLFDHAPWILERIYIANFYERYSQAQGHFPNIFLVDGDVSEARVTEVIHYPTYWLKYLLLKRIGLSTGQGVSLQQLLDEFSRDYLFEDKIVRLCVGSLNMVNESRCIEIIGAAKDDCHENLVRLTSRGRRLIGSNDNQMFPYCFELSYLQLVIDDHLLSIPKQWAPSVCVDSSLRYATSTGDKYSKLVRRELTVKFPAVIRFIRVLEAAWQYECKLRPKLAASSTLAPNFDVIYDRLREAIFSVSKYTNWEVNESLSQLESDRSSSLFNDFFDELISAIRDLERKYGKC